MSPLSKVFRNLEKGSSPTKPEKKVSVLPSKDMWEEKGKRSGKQPRKLVTSEFSNERRNP